MSDSRKLEEELKTIAKLGSALAVLGWDEEVNLPAGAHAYRGEVSALLASEAHKRATAKEFVGLAKKLATDKKLNQDEKVIARETWRDVKRAQKLPVSFVEEMSRLTTAAFRDWVEARQKKNFKVFLPSLEKIVAMKRHEAELIGYSGSPYDALLDGFEPDMTVAELDKLFPPLAQTLSELIKKTANKKQPELPQYKYNLDAQEALCKEISSDIGYDFNRGRLDVSPHPFTTTFHQTDVRITTRYDEDDFWVSLGSTIHEVGHGLYEQGLPAKFFGTPLGQPVSLGIHESQSRMWENLVGKSEYFAAYLMLLLKKHFKDQKLAYDEARLHAWLNRVKPNFIRVESDEVTYNLHIVLRYEIEKGLIEGTIKVADLPRVWNQKMKGLLGLDVPNDAMGVLQDVHWSHGLIGYFPTYSLGNLYAAQFYAAAKQNYLNLEKGFARGDFAPLLKWLRKNIHDHGRRYSSAELVKRVSGKPLDSSYLLRHLENVANL